MVEPLKLVSCPSTGTTAKASSVLNKNTGLYGAQHMLDTKNCSSCWNSDGNNKPKIIVINFNRKVDLCHKDSCIKIQFQGGFVGLKCETYVRADENTSSYVCLDDDTEDEDGKIIDAEDCNELQKFDLLINNNNQESLLREVRSIKLKFNESTDFYGRVTIYRFEVWGKERQ